MRVLKVMLAVAFVISIISIFRPIMPPGGTLGICLSIVNAAVFGGALYGIHRRAPLMWRLGFAAIIFTAANFLLNSLSVTRSAPTKAANAQTTFLVIATMVVTAYWLFWWKRQKPYFINASE